MAMPRLGDRAYYLYGASLRDPAYKHKYGPYAAMASLQRTLASDGVRTLDMWGVVEPDDTAADPAWQGFSAFKRTFGGQPLRHPGTFDLVVDPLWYRLREARNSLRGLLSRR
jgi:lipid II:glycine glycyltransferase (peptidoglycan interpeptide bridge formation enzyme)